MSEQTATPARAAKKKPAPKATPKVIDQDGAEVDQTGPDLISVTVGENEYQIVADARDDFELLDDLSRLDDGDITRFPAILRRLLTPQDQRKAMDSLRGENGRVGVLEGTRFVYEILDGLSPNS